MSKTKHDHKAFKFRIYPTKEQEEMLNQHCGNARFLWNKLLEINKDHHKKTKKFIWYTNGMSKIILKLKDEFEFLQKSFSQSLQQVGMRLDNALPNKKRRTKKGKKYKPKGFPKFKTKNKSKESFTCPQKWRYNKGCIYIPKIGEVKWVKHRPMQGKPKSITVSKDCGKWFVSVLCEIPLIDKVNITKKDLSSNNVIGLDVGVVRLATTSDNKYKKPLEFTELERKIKTAHRKIHRTIKGSKGREKAKQSLRLLYLKLRNKRRYELHKYSKALVDRSKAIFAEALKIKNMTKSAKGTLDKPGKNVSQKRGLNRSIQRQSWGILYSMLAYKAKQQGKMFETVNPKNTSRICNVCGFKSKANRVSQSKFVCQSCNHTANADQNAARNIRDRGIKQYLLAA